MRIGAGWLSAGIAALLLTTGCKDGRWESGQREGEQASAGQAVEQAQKQSEQAFDQAKDAQQKATTEQRDAVQAQRDLESAQQELTEAQARVQKEAQEAQQAQQQAQQQTQQAQQTAQQSQQTALEAQRQQQAELAQRSQQQAQQAQQQAQQSQQQAQATPPVDPTAAPTTQAQGEQLIVGQVLTASDRELLVSNRGEPQVRLQVQPGTVITVDGRMARAAEIREGSQVRASYNTQAGEPTATRIDVTTAQQPAAPAAPNSGESTPGAQPQQAPIPQD
jgi:hypothetical protein